MYVTSPTSLFVVESLIALETNQEYLIPGITGWPLKVRQAIPGILELISTTPSSTSERAYNPGTPL